MKILGEGRREEVAVDVALEVKTKHNLKIYILPCFISHIQEKRCRFLAQHWWIISTPQLRINETVLSIIPITQMGRLNPWEVKVTCQRSDRKSMVEGNRIQIPWLSATGLKQDSSKQASVFQISLPRENACKQGERQPSTLRHTVYPDPTQVYSVAQ